MLKRFEASDDREKRLDDATGTAIQGERSGWRIGPIPGAIKAGFGGERLSCRDGAIVGGIGDGHRTPTLGHAAIPQLRNGLPIGERELQTPPINGG